MAAPVVTRVTSDLYEGLGSGLSDADESTGWTLMLFVDAILKKHLSLVYELVKPAVTTKDPWETAMDADDAPAEGLGWLGQFVGVKFPAPISEADKRTRIRNREGWRRGTRQAMIDAIKLHLTGSKAVEITERDTSAYHFRVVTYAIETADSTKVDAEIRRQKPAGLQYAYVVQAGSSYAQLDAGFGTYADMDAALGTYDDTTNWVAP